MFYLHKALTYIKTHKRTIQVIIPMLAFLLICMGCYHIYKQKQIEKPVVITQQQSKSPTELSKAIHVTEQQAQEVISIKERTQPVATYYTQAPTVEVAAGDAPPHSRRRVECLPVQPRERSPYGVARRAPLVHADRHRDARDEWYGDDEAYQPC